MINLIELSDLQSLEARLLSSVRALEVLMSALSEKIAAIEAGQAKTDVALAAALARAEEDKASFQSDLDTQHEQIVTLQATLEALVDAGTATPEDYAALERIAAKEAEHQATLDILDIRKPDVLPDTPPVVPVDPEVPPVDPEVPPVDPETPPVVPVDPEAPPEVPDSGGSPAG
jgi:hypothetical protein